ncbi:MAG: dTMP kinase [Candidatus Poseidoniia archaeon]|jgi:dTMP kinase|nr:dTMP kinase [Candidatus Poseidoniia archaeon]MDP6441171.1 dTMP kinase [Candidatus Poseidoniia archaeon]MDP6591766.1 dTMP kinase [Candidatus Poseidoniia archaeon]MDP7095840.1 dTMP kinase [Candidatus Poseidoniia archaeon]MDP7665322.1 dTMP kinase [Candidatus Poseidoniia archaeon]|tara:strand:+ start:448 stop:1041 length:594 start_codon:yes stop_codon:yes gene_type:complete
MIEVLVNLEGIDGCGKSTQSKLLREKLEGEGEKVIILKEPTKRPHGQKLWDMLHGKRKATNEEILELFVLDRKQHVEEKIQPALNDGNVVLMDRYYYSSMAYQVAGGIDVEDIREKHAFAPKPDIVLIFDLPVSVALERVKGHSDADEFEKDEHLKKVRIAYLDLENDPLVRIVDATGTPEEIFGNVWKLVSEVRNG